MRLFPRISTSLVLSLALAGCFGGGSGSSTHKGRFIDSPVSGLGYHSGDPAASSLTDEAGQFTYQRGQTVTFFVGDIVLGSAAGSPIITLRSLTGGAAGDSLPNAAINIGRLLLTLDADADPSNGIQLSNATTALAAGLPALSKLDFDLPPELFVSRAISATQQDGKPESAFEELVRQQSGAGRDGDFADETEAKEHIMCSEQDLNNGAEPDGSCVTGQNPEITVDDVSVTEGQNSEAVINVTRAGNINREFTLNYATNSLVSDSTDYVAANGTIEFGRGVTSRTITVQILDDGQEESVETVQVDLTSADSSVIFLRDQANISILDDDKPKTSRSYNVSVAFEKVGQTVHVDEGNFGTTPVYLRVRRDGDLEPAVKALFSTEESNGATPGNDYYQVVDGEINFLPGQMEKVISVRVRGDREVDPDESFEVKLTEVSGADAADTVLASFDSAPVTIAIDDDDVVDPDPDKDGLTNEEEEALGTDPNDPDTDNDGVNDKEDAFPLDITEQADDDQDGIGNNADPDDDNDEVLDGVDACPNTPSTDTEIRGDGCGESQQNDQDSDGVENDDDLCPGTGFQRPVDPDNGCAVEQLPTASFAVDNLSTDENLSPVTITVQLDQPAIADTSVVLALIEDTAKGAGVDFGKATDVLLDDQQDGVWEEGVIVLKGESQASLSIDITDDSETEFLERFSLELRGADNAQLGTPSATVVAIVDDETRRTAVRVGASKKVVDPTAAHIEGVDEARFGTTTHKQKFNLGGFGVDPLQNFPDPVGSAGDDNPFGQTLTQPAEQPCLLRDQASYDSASYNPNTDCIEHTWVRAMVIETPEAGERVAFVVLDAVGAGNVIQKSVRTAITGATGISSDNIVFGQTHTHAGADLQGLWGGVPQDWIDNVMITQAANAVAEAVANLEPVELTVAQGDMSDFNRYRRPRQTNPDAETDVLGTLLTATSLQEQGKVVANLMQFSGHPTSVNEDPRIPHPDYPLGVVDTLERDNSVALFFNGPIADASSGGHGAPCDTKPDYPADNGTYAGVHCKGEGMAEAAQGFDNPKPLAATVNVKNQAVYMPVTNPLFVGGGLTGAFNKYYDFTETHQYSDQIPELGEQARFLPQLAPYAVTNVTRITIGGADSGLEIVTIPGEATGTFGGWIRSLPSDNATTMLLGLTQNSFGYIIPEEEFRYIDASGDDGFTVPFTGYEEFLSLGPLTAPLLRMEG